MTTMLIILDGWGINPETAGNAVAQANTPFLDHLFATYPHTRLDCSGEAVGLPPGIMGNSEVGHLNIGAGRVVYQDLLRIDRAIESGGFFENPVLGDIMGGVAASGRTLHFMGLVSDGGVHSQLTHLLALLDMARQKGVETVCVHAIMDGRDTPPDSGIGYLQHLQAHVQAAGTGRIASICGRYYAMDRDQRWDRIEKAYRLYTEGEGVAAADPVAAIRAAYDRGETDEFIKPIFLKAGGEHPAGFVEAGDAVIFFNFRADRAREITRALMDPAFDGFPRRRLPALSGYACMTLYDENFDLPVAFPPEHLDRILGEVVSEHGLRQLRIAETEKYAHVTYFFNGGEERPFPLEDRCLIPSPREVPTYDHKPEMSAPEVTRELLSRIRTGAYHLIVLNFANMDMVGHTGVLDAAIRAAETVDRCLKQIVDVALERNDTVMVTADHGNAERMVSDTGGPHTAHTTNQVPLVLVDDRRRSATLKPGRLGDIAPTLLHLMGIEKPGPMTGESLLVEPDGGR